MPPKPNSSVQPAQSHVKFFKEALGLLACGSVFELIDNINKYAKKDAKGFSFLQEPTGDLNYPTLLEGLFLSPVRPSELDKTDGKLAQFVSNKIKTTPVESPNEKSVRLLAQALLSRKTKTSDAILQSRRFSLDELRSMVKLPGYPHASSLLHFACGMNNVSAAEQLLEHATPEHEAQLTELVNYGLLTPLNMAIDKGAIDCAQLLLDRQLKRENLTREQVLALINPSYSQLDFQQAATRLNEQQGLDAGAVRIAVPPTMNLALTRFHHYARSPDQKAGFDFLMRQGVPLDLPCESVQFPRWTPLDFVAAREPFAAEWLIEIAKQSDEARRLVVQAVERRGKVALVQNALVQQKGEPKDLLLLHDFTAQELAAPVHQPTDQTYKLSLLQVLCQRGDVATVRLLLDKLPAAEVAPLINQTSEHGFSNMLFALQAPTLDVANELVARGGVANPQDVNGLHAIHYIASKEKNDSKDVRAMQFFAQQNIDLALPCESSNPELTGWNALHLAVLKGKVLLFLALAHDHPELLKEIGTQPGQNSTPMQLLVTSGEKNVTAFQQLLGAERFSANRAVLEQALSQALPKAKPAEMAASAPAPTPTQPLPQRGRHKPTVTEAPTTTEVPKKSPYLIYGPLSRPSWASLASEESKERKKTKPPKKSSERKLLRAK